MNKVAVNQAKVQQIQAQISELQSNYTAQQANAQATYNNQLATLQKNLAAANAEPDAATTQTTQVTPVVPNAGVSVANSGQVQGKNHMNNIVASKILITAMRELAQILKQGGSGVMTVKAAGENMAALLAKMEKAIEEMGLRQRDPQSLDQNERDVVEMADRLKASVESFSQVPPPAVQEPKNLLIAEDDVEQTRREQSANPALAKTAGENPFAKKDDDKKEDKGEDKKEEKKDEKKSDDKPSFPAKKDEEKKDDKKEEKKDDKKPAPFEKKDDKKEDKSEPKKSESKPEGKKEDKDEKGEKSDVAEAKKAIKIIEDLLAKEEGEEHGEPPAHLADLKMALEDVKKFLLGEEAEMGMPGMGDTGMGMPELGLTPSLDMKDPNKIDIVKTGPAVPLPPPGMKPEPALGLEKNLHPITDALPVGPAKPKLPAIDKKPKVDMAKDMGNTSGLKVNDRVWTKTAGEVYEIDDEPGRVIAIAGSKIIVDFGDDIPSEMEANELVVAKPVDNEGTMFEAPAPSIEEEASMGLSAFTPVSHEVQKVLSTLSFADVMAQHLKGEKDSPFEIK